jgi:hypothetical protein
MAASKPNWDIGDLVYVEASAKVGFLEAYKVSNIVRARGRWLYTIDVNQKPPSEPTVMSMVDIKNTDQIFFDESELINYKDALLLMKRSLDIKTKRVNQLIKKYFPEGTET